MELKKEILKGKNIIVTSNSMDKSLVVSVEEESSIGSWEVYKKNNKVFCS